MMTIFLYLIITLQCSRHSTLRKNTKQTFILLFVPPRSSCSNYATRGTRGLTSSEHLFLAIPWREQGTFFCTRPTRLLGLLQCWHTKTTVCGWICRSIRTHYSDFEPTSLCSYSLLMHAQRRSIKHQCYSHLD